MKTKKKNNQLGFTLIELLIAVAIMGILASIAVPSYFEYVKRTARAGAITALIDAANKQEQYFVDNRQYATSLDVLGVASPTENGYYRLKLDVRNEVGRTVFYITAIPIAGPPLKDTECTRLLIDDRGIQRHRGTAESSAVCWVR